MRVLIVDDDFETRVGLAELLAEAGFHPTSVASLDDALRILRTTQQDFLITDFRLGDSNGLQLMAHCPERIPTIMLTGLMDRDLESEATREGAVYILKPVSPSVLVQQIRNMLGGTPAETLGHND
jgi:two-component system response regulator HydG